MSDYIDHLQDLEKRLNARDPETVPKRTFGILRPVKQTVESSWGDTKLPEGRTRYKSSLSGYKRFFIFSIIFFAIGLGIALFSMYRGALTLSSKNVDLAVLGNSFVAGGEALPIQIEIANKNASDLIDAELTLDYPKGATDEAGSDVAHLKQVLGTIPSGKTKSQEFSVVLYGEQGTSRTITATLSYKLAGSISVFQKESSFSVLVSSSPLALTIDGPATAGSNQPFTLSVRSLFTGDRALEGAILRVEYPNGFVFESATPAPISSNNVWSLGDIQKGSEQAILIKGKLVGEQTDEKAFRVYVGSRESAGDNRIGVAYNSALHTVTISEPFMSGTIAVNGQKGPIVAIANGDSIKGVLSWTNNSPVTVTNPVFTLALSGPALDPSTVVVGNGYYNPLEGTATWTADSDSTLASIAPGATGQLPFSFSTREVSGDPGEISLGLSIAGVFPDRNFAQASVANIDAITVRFASRLQFAAQSLYSIGPFINTGPMPPKADQETTYTLTWTMRPTDNALTGAQATAVLPAGVTWVGAILPASEKERLQYNPDTRTVVWGIGTMPKVTSIPQVKTVSFQVKVRPTKAQVGSPLSLLGATTITATDSVANVPLSATRGELSTRLDTDPAYTTGGGVVLP